LNSSVSIQCITSSRKFFYSAVHETGMVFGVGGWNLKLWDSMFNCSWTQEL